eukprot:TRINITY_DN23845_c0_g1_i1.p1 TRINITY_DN23845_c0_g1~~TRINITY_DN23845_c0_g1_i1.p1  ORF type:complete len:358 (+),score=48.65 TRINITY_DN23845_c0_g1_i1:110-1183(+)
MSLSSVQTFNVAKYGCKQWGGRHPFNKRHRPVSPTANTYVPECPDNDHGDQAYWDRAAPMKVEPSLFLGSGFLSSGIRGTRLGLGRTPQAATACKEQLCDFGMPEPVACRPCLAPASIFGPPPGLERSPRVATACEANPCDSGMPASVSCTSCPAPDNLSRKFHAHAIQGEPAAMRCQSQRHSARQGQVASTVHADNQMRCHEHFVCEILFPGYCSEHHADFDLVPRLIGRGAVHVKEIAAAGARVSLVGEGSSAVPASRFKGRDRGGNESLEDGTDSDMPLKMVLSSSSAQSLEAALQTAQKQLSDLEKHWACFCRKKHRPKSCPSHSALHPVLPLWKLGSCRDLLPEASVKQVSM